MRPSALALLLLLSAGPAGAQSLHDRSAPSLSSKDVFLLSAGATAALVGAGVVVFDVEHPVGATLMAAGLLAGPSAGALALGRYDIAGLGLATRLGGAALTTYGVGLAWDGDSNGEVAVAVGLILYGAGVVVDVASTMNVAHRASLAPAVDLRAGVPVAVVRVGL